MLHRGFGSGHLHEKRIGRKISPGLAFEGELGDEEKPWAELLDKGTFSAETLHQPPRSFNVSDGWIALLRESARTHGATWLHHLHLGVALMEAGDLAEARVQLQSSRALQKTPQPAVVWPC